MVNALNTRNAAQSIGGKISESNPNRIESCCDHKNALNIIRVFK